MSDYGSRVTDKAIDATARKVRKVYEKAAKELKRKLADFQQRHLKKQTEMLAKLEAGEITKSAYDSWMLGQVFIGKQWKAKIDQAVRIMEDANAEAAEIVRKGKFNVFAENYNFAAYQLEKQARGVISFNLYSTESVAKLITDKPKMLPEWKIDLPKDYIWNRQKVENVVTQGIIQGSRMDEITVNLANTLCSQNENKMRTFARTSMTGAQNAGRQAQMEDAEEEGIRVKKKWVATLDNRTRDTHQELDGQTVPVDEPFTVDVDGTEEEIMYPGDPNAEPCLVYNCRCTMVQVYEGIERKSVRRAYEDEDETGRRKSYIVEDMTYPEWKEWKKNHGR